LGGSSGSSRDSFPNPIRVKIPETVEGGIDNVSAISAPVIRNRLRAAIRLIRSSPVRSPTTAGTDERSNRPCSPSSR
jgi:hypothetical protein